MPLDFQMHLEKLSMRLDWNNWIGIQWVESNEKDVQIKIKFGKFVNLALIDQKWTLHFFLHLSSHAHKYLPKATMSNSYFKSFRIHGQSFIIFFERKTKKAIVNPLDAFWALSFDWIWLEPAIQRYGCFNFHSKNNPDQCLFSSAAHYCYSLVCTTLENVSVSFCWCQWKIEKMCVVVSIVMGVIQKYIYFQLESGNSFRSKFDSIQKQVKYSVRCTNAMVKQSNGMLWKKLSRSMWCVIAKFFTPKQPNTNAIKWYVVHKFRRFGTPIWIQKRFWNTRPWNIPKQTFHPNCYYLLDNFSPKHSSICLFWMAFVQFLFFLVHEIEQIWWTITLDR